MEGGGSVCLMYLHMTGIVCTVHVLRTMHAPYIRSKYDFLGLMQIINIKKGHCQRDAHLVPHSLPSPYLSKAVNSTWPGLSTS